MKKLIGFFLILLLTANVNAQIHAIGKDAESMKRLVEYSTNEHNQTDNYGNTSSSYWSNDVVYNDGEIAEVIQCYDNQLILNWKITADYCEHYIMENDTVAYILTEFKNVSVNQLRTFLIGIDNCLYDKRKDKYFTQDSTYYEKVYLSDNGLATIEYRITNKGIKKQNEEKAKKYAANQEEQNEALKQTAIDDSLRKRDIISDSLRKIESDRLSQQWDK